MAQLNLPLTNVSVHHVPLATTEIEGTYGAASTMVGEHWLIVWGEEAERGEPDGFITVVQAIDEEGDDISELIADTIAQALAPELPAPGDQIVTSTVFHGGSDTTTVSASAATGFTRVAKERS